MVPLGSQFVKSLRIFVSLGLMVQREWLLAWQEFAVAHPRSLAGEGEGRLGSWYLDSETEINSFVLPGAFG